MLHGSKTYHEHLFSEKPNRFPVLDSVFTSDMTLSPQQHRMLAKRRLGLFGGSFDPVHNGHLTIARKLSKVFGFEFVLFIPAHHAPHKKSAVVTSPFHRYAMLALATMNDPGLRISTVELNAPQRPYTIDTLNRLSEQFGAEFELFFIMGGDLWNEIDTWHEWRRVLAAVNHVVVSRPGFDLFTTQVSGDFRSRIVDLRGQPEKALEPTNSDQGTGVYLTDAVRMDVSATLIRNSLTPG